MNFDLGTCTWDQRIVDKTGTMVNRETGLRIHGTVKRFTRSREEIGFSIDGTTVNNAFRWNSWTFEPDREPDPTPADVFDAIPIGEYFVLQARHEEWLMLKITEADAFYQEIRSRHASMAWRKIKPGRFGRGNLGSDYFKVVTI